MSVSVRSLPPPVPIRTRPATTGQDRIAWLATALLFTGALVPAAPALAVPAVPAGASAIPAAADIHTERTSTGSYAVYVKDVKLATVPVSDPGFSVRAVLSPDARQAAVITDFDGRSGKSLLLLDTDSGTTSPVATGAITSAAFAPDGRLGYLTAGTDTAEVRTYAPGGVAGATTVARIAAQDSELLGWTADGSAAFVQQRDDRQASAPSLSRVELATGLSRPLLTSDPARGVVYRDFRISTIGGAVRISGIRADHIYPCAGRASGIFLADEYGTVLSTLGTTSDAYREVVFSEDGKQVAYAIQGCVSTKDKITSRVGALQRLEALNGVYLRDLATGQTHRVVQGVTTNFRLDGFTGTAVRFTSERYGTRTVDAGRVDAATATQLDAAGSDIGIQSKIVPSTHIHQLWDTADNFNGNSACGPTSSVMDLAGYQLASQNGYWVSVPSSHWSPYGGYITNAYSAYGTTFNRYGPDPNWNYFAGAYGWMVTDPNIGSWHASLRDYLDRHVSYAIAETGSVTWSWVKSKIDANLMVVVSGNFVYGRYGHIALITGYLDDGRVYVNDPYGAGTDGSWDGKDTVYTFDYMRAGYAWAA